MSENKTVKAAIYCRTNTQDQTGIESQKAIAMKIAEEQELEIFDIYIDIGYSGLNYERAALKRMLTDIENGEIDCVIISSYSRLGRAMISNMQINNRIEKAGVFFVIADMIQNQQQGGMSLC